MRLMRVAARARRATVENEYKKGSGKKKTS